MSFTPDPANKWADLMAQEEAKYNLPSGILQSIARHESNFTPDAGNTSSGAQGMMQFMPSTWAGLPADLAKGDPKNAEDAIKAAAYYLSVINKGLPADKQNDPGWMAAAYNIGSGAVQNMTTYDDIVAYSKKQGYKDAEARAQYAKDINQEVSSASVPNAGATGPGAIAGAGQPNFLSQYNVIQGYGANPQNYARFGLPGHDGLDYNVPYGTPLPSLVTGTVVREGYDANGWGHYVMVDAGDGTYVAYGHLSETDVKQGQQVNAGDILGLSGGEGPESGNSSGAHLHVAVRKGGTTQKYNVDPTPYIAKWSQQQPLTSPASPATIASTGPASPVVGEKQPAVGQAPGSPVSPVEGVAQGATQPNLKGTNAVTAPVSPESAPASASTTGASASQEQPSGTVPWTASPEALLNDFNNRNNSPERVQAQASVDQAFADIEQRAKTTYPQYADLYDKYNLLTPDQKKDFTAQNPMIRALHMAGYNPDQWKYLEDTFGQGTVEKWANIPAYSGESSDERSQYYHQHPEIFLANAYVRGRPELYDESAFDPTKPFEYNFGKDYEEAKAKFGDGIWDTVKQYYTIPPYVKGGDNKAWIQFKTDHPEFDDWRVWWYEKLGNSQQTSQFGQFGGFHGGSGFQSRNRPGMATQNFVNQVAYQHESPPKYVPQSSGGADDWKQWLSLTESQLKSWRR